jgi:hypothetical protein
MWRSVATFAPKLVAFLLILIIGWIVAKLIAKAVDKILERVGFDRAVERGGVSAPDSPHFWTMHARATPSWSSGSTGSVATLRRS